MITAIEHHQNAMAAQSNISPHVQAMIGCLIVDDWEMAELLRGRAVATFETYLDELVAANRQRALEERR